MFVGPLMVTPLISCGRGLGIGVLVLNSRFCAKKIENSEVATINKFESVFLCSG